MNFLRRRKESVDETVGGTGTTKADRNKDKDVRKDGEVSAYFAPTRIPLVDRHTNVPPSSHRVSIFNNDDLRHDQEQRETSTVLSNRPVAELPIPGQIFHGARSASFRSRPSSYLHWSDTVHAGSVIVTTKLSHTPVGVDGSLALEPAKQKENIGLVSDGLDGPPKLGLPVPPNVLDDIDVLPDPQSARPEPSRRPKRITKAMETVDLDLTSAPRADDTRFPLPPPHIRSNSVEVRTGRTNQLLEDPAPRDVVSGQEIRSLSIASQVKNQRNMSEPATSSSIGKLLEDCDTACNTYANMEAPVRLDRRGGHSRAQANIVDGRPASGASELRDRRNEERFQYVPHQTELWTTSFRRDFDADRLMIEQYESQDNTMYWPYRTGQYSVNSGQIMSSEEEYEEPTDSYREEEQADRLRREFSTSNAGRRSETLFGSYEVPRVDRSLEGALAGFWRPNRLY
jgi:hypothetical protein